MNWIPNGILLLTCCAWTLAFPFSQVHHEEIAAAFTTNVLSGMNYFPKEKQIQVVKTLLEENDQRYKERRLSDSVDREVFYVQLKESVPLYEFVEQLQQDDINSEFEMIGGESHSLIVYSFDHTLLQMNEAFHQIQAFFPFPAISKITIQLVNEIEKVASLKGTIVLEVSYMGQLDYSQWTHEFASQCGICSPTLHPMEQLLQWINHPPTEQGDCSITFSQEDTIVVVSVDATHLLQAIAFLSRKSCVVRIDLQSHYTLPPTLSSLPYMDSARHLRDYFNQEVMSTREEVQSLYAHNLHGEDQIIGLSDTGVDVHSCFFVDEQHAVRYDSASNDTHHRKIYLYYPFSNDKEDGSEAHGTHVAGTLVGEVPTDGSDLSSYNGIAYKARLAFVDIGSGKGKDSQLETPRKIVQLVEAIHQAGAQIHSASWGAYASSYTSDTASIDTYIYQHPDCFVAFAAGNEGEKGARSIYAPSSGKNVLSVGSVYNSPSYHDIRAPFSCEGPTSDNRIKPDIMAPGVNIDSAASSGEEELSCRIVEKTGTSMSTPIVAATTLLLAQYLKEGYYPSGVPREEDGFTPTAATLKALIIHSGEPLRGEGSLFFPTLYDGTFPDNKQGFGRMNINNVLYWRNESSTNLLIRETEVNRTLTRVSFIILINPSQDFKTTIVWTDPPVSTFSSNVLVNDLDLTVHYGNTTFYPNNLSTYDRNNNVEVILIPKNTIQSTDSKVNVTVSVNAHRLETKTQTFSIVMTGEFDNESQPIVIRDDARSSASSLFLFIGVLLTVQYIL